MERDIPRAPLPGERPWIPQFKAPELLWPRQPHQPGPAKWTRYTLKARQTCTTCVRVCLDHEKDPYPRPPGHPNPATQIRTVGIGADKTQSWHCSPHAQELKRLDEIWVREKATARRHAEHLARGARY